MQHIPCFISSCCFIQTLEFLESVEFATVFFLAVVGVLYLTE